MKLIKFYLIIIVSSATASELEPSQKEQAVRLKYKDYFEKYHITDVTPIDKQEHDILIRLCIQDFLEKQNLDLSLIATVKKSMEDSEVFKRSQRMPVPLGDIYYWLKLHGLKAIY